MLKTYKSKTVISTSVLIGNSVSHIRFSPHSYGGSVYTTDNENIQKALESSRQFGKLFHLDSEINTKEQNEGTASEYENAAGPTVETKEVTVSDIEEARDYLETNFNVKRSAMRRKSSVQEIASNYGIKFVGI